MQVALLQVQTIQLRTRHIPHTQKDTLSFPSKLMQSSFRAKLEKPSYLTTETNLGAHIPNMTNRHAPHCWSKVMLSRLQPTHTTECYALST